MNGDGYITHLTCTAYLSKGNLERTTRYIECHQSDHGLIIIIIIVIVIVIVIKIYVHRHN